MCPIGAARLQLLLDMHDGVRGRGGAEHEVETTHAATHTGWLGGRQDRACAGGAGRQSGARSVVLAVVLESNDVQHVRHCPGAHRYSSRNVLGVRLMKREATFCDRPDCDLVAYDKCLGCRKDLCRLHTSLLVAFDLTATPYGSGGPSAATKCLERVVLRVCESCQGRVGDINLKRLAEAIGTPERLFEVWDAIKAAEALGR